MVCLLIDDSMSMTRKMKNLDFCNGVVLFIYLFLSSTTTVKWGIKLTVLLMVLLSAQWLKKTKRKALFASLEKIKEGSLKFIATSIHSCVQMHVSLSITVQRKSTKKF